MAERMDVFEQKLENFGEAQKRTEQKVDAIGDTLRVLVRIEERQIATNDRLDASIRTQDNHAAAIRTLELSLPEHLDRRLVAIETKLPGLVESRKWLLGGMAAGVGAAFTAVAHFVTGAPK